MCSPASDATDPLVIFGVGVFNDGLTTAAAFPQPDDEEVDPYMAWGMLFGQSNLAFATRPGGFMAIDSKGKRRFDSDDRIVLLLKGVASGHTALVQLSVFCLVIPDQGR